MSPMLRNMLEATLDADTIHQLGKLKAVVKSWTLPSYWENSRRLGAYRSKHVGERCFIIGNGPSLAKVDLRPLRNEVTFGLNRIYLLFEKIGFATTYYVAVNPYVIEQCAADIAALPCPKFISWNSRHDIPSASDMMFLRLRQGPRFCTDVVTEGVWDGTTVTYVAMQLAYYMGFRQVILIGVDHEFQTKGEPNALMTSEGGDQNHFSPDYFGKGFRWQLPDLQTSEQAYHLARHHFQQHGREIVDATVGGKLQVFHKVSYERVIAV